MLHINITKTNDTIISNDMEFMNNTFSIITSETLMGKKCRNIIEQIEHVQFIQGSNNKLIISKFTGTAIPLTSISTGCKTYINIICNPQKPIFIGECDDKIINLIFKLKNGEIYIPYKIIPYGNEYKTMKFICKSNEVQDEVTGISGLEGWIDKHVN